MYFTSVIFLSSIDIPPCSINVLACPLDGAILDRIKLSTIGRLSPVKLSFFTSIVGIFSEVLEFSNRASADSFAFIASSSPCIIFVISKAAIFLASFIFSPSRELNFLTSSIGRYVNILKTS
ncbi:unknown [Clostridium sp. CAG:1219]|nr:unknown [Clostridium sp. CAG:1219]